MKLNNLLTACFLITSSSAFAQSGIPNAGFENWVNVGLYEDPVDWETSNTTNSQNFGIATLTKTTDAHSGNYAIKLQRGTRIDTSGGITVITNFNSYVRTPGFNAPYAFGGIPFMARPINISGYYKYFPTTISDSFQVAVILTNFTNTPARQIVGIAEFTTGAFTPTYSGFSETIHYYNNLLPDTVFILFNENKNLGQNFSDSTILYLDDLQFGGLTGVEEGLAENNRIKVYPNPASTHLNITLSENAAISEIRLTDLLGRRILTEQHPILSSGSQPQLSTAGVPNGLFLLELKTIDGNISQQRVMIRH